MYLTRLSWERPEKVGTCKYNEKKPQLHSKLKKKREFCLYSNVHLFVRKNKERKKLLRKKPQKGRKWKAICFIAVRSECAYIPYRIQHYRLTDIIILRREEVNGTLIDAYSLENANKHKCTYMYVCIIRFFVCTHNFV